MISLFSTLKNYGLFCDYHFVLVFLLQLEVSGTVVDDRTATAVEIFGTTRA